MSLVVRYIKNNIIHETYLGFEELKSTTGAGIAEKILASLENYGIDLLKMRGQAYDGCAAMKGDINGAQAIIQSKYPKALYDG